MPRSLNKGFTLIELSIVLIIIGLIIGGVLVGRDMIQAAELRATVGQLEKYRTAINTFRGKYNCMPGDCDKFASFGFQTRGGTVGRGDGNGKIEYCDLADQSYDMQGCETNLFWRDLSESNLISESFVTATDAHPHIQAANLYLYYPQPKFSKTNYIIVFNSGILAVGAYPQVLPNLNYFGIMALPIGITGANGDGVQPDAKITPNEAYGIDIKTDDGAPLTGTVLSGRDDNNDFALVGSAGVGFCATAADTYNLDPSYADTQTCMMNIQM